MDVEIPFTKAAISRNDECLIEIDDVISVRSESWRNWIVMVAIRGWEGGDGEGWFVSPWDFDWGETFL